MFTMLSGVRFNSAGCHHPYMGSIASNLNPHAFAGGGRRRRLPTPTSTTARPAATNSPPPPPQSTSSSDKIHSLEIILDKGSKPVFEPGQEVTGRLVVRCGGAVKFRSLSVCLRGVARVHWSEPRAPRTRLGSYTEQYNAEMEYINEKR